ncbi:MAG TPA: TMEM175 family protein [Actinomycetota bacterium]
MTKNRLEAFSDGVFAIAITLLVIEIRPPQLGPGETLWHALLAQWPSYVGYLVSFATIGVIWLNTTACSSRWRASTGRCWCSTSTCCCGRR